MAYKSGNPALNKETFNKPELTGAADAMTLDGVARKSLALLILCVGAGWFGWQAVIKYPSAGIFIIGAVILALIISLIIIFKQKTAPALAPVYAIVEGFAIGAISQFYEQEYGGIVLQAALLTISIFAAMLMLYRFRIIKVTENFKLAVAAATMGIALYYLVNLGLTFFGNSLPLIASNSWYGIAFSVVVVGLAAFNLVVDFDFIESGVNQRAPKYMEWYASFGLFVTVIWLYLELLRLLAKARSR